MPDRMPAECFSVGSFIAEELKARDWTPRDLAIRMGCYEPEKSAMWELTLDFLMNVDEPGAHLGMETAQELGRGFGTSAGLWMNIDRLYRQWRGWPPPLEDSNAE